VHVPTSPITAPPTTNAPEDAIRNVILDRNQTSPTCGCMAKYPGVQLAADLKAADPDNDDREPTDCAVFTIGAATAVASVDIGPLVGTDVYRAGRIAVFHATSDVWATGATPTIGLAIVAVDTTLPIDTTTVLMSGMFAACREEGVELMGGHTIIGAEALAGMVVIGVAGTKTLKKIGARPGDVLMLSKPLGTGMVIRAFRQGIAGIPELETALNVMDTSNQPASLAAIEAGVTALTDVTGFGLLGHLAEMLSPESLGAVLTLGDLPVLPAARALPALFDHSTYIDNNLDYARSRLRVTSPRDRHALAPMLDPQTSGGLLAAVHPGAAPQLEAAGYRRVGIVTATHELEIRA
jgi:selenide,water dikinase